MTQLDFFNEEKLNELCEDGLVCIKCDIRQPIANFQQMSYTKTGDAEIKRTCKSCQKGHRQIIASLRKENVYPQEASYECPICKRTIDEVNKYNQKLLGTWVLDHCHDTNTFRGYICKHCNDGLGGFRDNLTTVKNAVKYLEQHKEKLDEDNT